MASSAHAISWGSSADTAAIRNTSLSPSSLGSNAFVNIGPCATPLASDRTPWFRLRTKKCPPEISRFAIVAAISPTRSISFAWKSSMRESNRSTYSRPFASSAGFPVASAFATSAVIIQWMVLVAFADPGQIANSGISGACTRPCSQGMCESITRVATSSGIQSFGFGSTFPGGALRLFT